MASSSSSHAASKNDGLLPLISCLVCSSRVLIKVADKISLVWRAPDVVVGKEDEGAAPSRRTRERGGSVQAEVTHIEGVKSGCC
jgi:hypothetical protein